MWPAAPARDGGPTGNPLQAKRFFIVGLALGVVAMSAVGLATAALVESPAQVAAEGRPPPRSVITALARWRPLTQTVTVAGTVTATRTVDVTASAPYRVVAVTKMPVHAGDVVRPGQVIAEVDGRPVLLLQGRLPAFRDLREGDAGPDVAQLQEALEELGFVNFDPLGTFGKSTALALTELYARLGYPVPVVRQARPGGSRWRAHPPRRASSSPAVPDAELPASEVVYIPARSALVVAVGARAGTIPGTRPILRLATGHPYVRATLDAEQAALAHAGLPVTIASASPALTARGILTRIGKVPVRRGRGSAGLRYPIEVTPRRRLHGTLAGTPVRLTIQMPVTAGPVLSVPLAAVVGHGGARSAYVIVVGRRGARWRVPVFTGPVADGRVAVQPAGRSPLRPGARVEIGMSR